MSSYICSAKHFNSISEGLKTLVANNNFYVPFEFSSEFKNIYYKRISCNTDLEFIVDTLRQINVLSVSLQYKNHFEGKLDSEIILQNLIVKEKTSIVKLSPINLFKQLKCLNYQIELEHIKELRNLTDAEEKAMLFLNLIINAIACYICEESSQYDECAWGID